MTTTTYEPTKNTNFKDALELYTSYGIPCIYTSIINRNGDKILRYINPKNPPSDYPKGLKELPYHLWTMKQCKAFNKWVLKNHQKDLTHFVGIPNQAQYLVIDVDSQSELDGLSERGFPINNAIHTKSTNKKLPHYLINYEGRDMLKDADVCKILGKTSGIEMDIDLITNVIYERLDGEVFGEDIYYLEPSQIEYMVYDNRCSIQVKESIEEQRKRGNSQKRTIFKVKSSKKLGSKGKSNIDQALDMWRDYWDGICFDVETSDNELIPYEIMEELLNHLDYERYNNFQDWKKITIAFANNIPPHCNHTKWVKMYLTSTLQYPNYQDNYAIENVELILNITKSSKDFHKSGKKKITSNTLWKYLQDCSVDKWKELAFHKDRPLDAMEFRKLTFVEALKVFNEHFAFVRCDTKPYYVEWDGNKQDYKTYTKDKLKECYENFQYLGTDKNGDECYKEDFISQWIKHPSKTTYHGETFAPPPMIPRKGYFNYFRGFAIDKIPDYDEEVNALSKEELEEQLTFIFNHIRILCGEDRTEECFLYTLRWFGSIIKYPAELPRVMINWVSKQGVGKNQMLNFIRFIIGEWFYYSSEKLEDFFGTFNSCISYKLLLNLNEMENGYKYEKNLKTLITERTTPTTKKYHETINLPNYSRTTGTSNTGVSVNLEDSDRRMAIFRCSSKIVDSDVEVKKSYNTELNRQINDIFIQKCFVRYVREFLDLPKGYDFENNRPITLEYQLTKQKHCPVGSLFFKWMYEQDRCNQKFNRTQLFKQFNEWCEKTRDYKSSMGETKFRTDVLAPYSLPANANDWTPHLLEKNVNMFLQIEHTNKWFYTILKDRCKVWLEKNLYEFNEPSQFDTDSNEDSDDE
tara:strand:- start:1055 stop:3640 length:2586 start_codon:yes stop_codon:yes gene_type:complete